MYTINDPMFALILRFVGRTQKVVFHDDEFIRKQMEAIQVYIEQFSPPERERRALEWIEAHASAYRKAWEKETIGKEFSCQRCPDCPLAAMDESAPCGVHDEWLNLLRQYAADEITSKEYVRDALKLMTRHKENLRVKLSVLRGEKR